MKTHTNYCESDIDAHRPDVEDGVAHQRLVAAEAGDREGRQAPDAEALVFPRQQVVGEVDLLVHELERHREARAERLELLQRTTAVCVGRTVNGVDSELLQRTTTVAVGRLVGGINLLVHQLKSYQELSASQTPTKSPLDDWSTVLTEDFELLQTTTTVSVGGQLAKGLDGVACAQRLKLLQRTIAVAVGRLVKCFDKEPQTSTKDNHSLRWTISVKVIGLLLQQLKWNRELQCHPNVHIYYYDQGVAVLFNPVSYAISPAGSFRRRTLPSGVWRRAIGGRHRRWRRDRGQTSRPSAGCLLQTCRPDMSKMYCDSARPIWVIFTVALTATTYGSN